MRASQISPAKDALDRIAAIYAIEARAAHVPIAGRLPLRSETVPPIAAFFAWAAAMTAKLNDVNPKA